MNLNQYTIIGFVGKDAESKSLSNGTPAVKFSVATKKSVEGRERRVEEQDAMAYRLTDPVLKP